MKIKSWHVGKIVLLWAWGAAAIMVGLRVLKEYRDPLTEHVLIGFGLLFVLVLVPMLLSVVTWKWFTGKERDANTPPADPNQSESSS